MLNRIVPAVLLLVIMSVVVHAQEEVPQLEEIVVTATKTEREVKDVPTNVTVITREDIEKYHARDVSELLGQVPGFSVSGFGGVHADMYVSSRGNQPSTRAAQILVDGIEYNDTSGYFNVLAIPIGDIERIEVVKNPASSLYGNFGTGGVVNLITRRPTKPFETKIGASYGSFETHQYSAVLNGTRKNWEYYAEGRFYKTDGWQDNSWEENKLLHAKLKYHPDETSTVGLHVNYAPISNGYPGTLTEAQFREDPRQTTQPFGDSDSYNFLGAVFFDKAFGDSKVYAKAKYGLMDGWCIDPDYFDMESYNIVPELGYSLGHALWGMSGMLLIGGEYRFFNNKKSKAYEVVNGMKGDLYQDRTWKDSTWAFFAQEELEVWKDLLISAGVRHDHVDTEFTDHLDVVDDFDEAHSAWSPKAGATYTANGSDPDFCMTSWERGRPARKRRPRWPRSREKSRFHPSAV